MATPIKITPTITGKDAVFFNKQLAQSSKKNYKKSIVTNAEKRKINRALEKFIKNKTA